MAKLDATDDIISVVPQLGEDPENCITDCNPLNGRDYILKEKKKKPKSTEQPYRILLHFLHGDVKKPGQE